MPMLPLPRLFLLPGFLLVVLIVAPAAQAELSARLNSTKVDETQTVELTIRTDSRDVQGMPDLKGVSKDFEILTNPRTNSQYRSINGNVQAFTEWTVALRPLRVGTLNIPAISYRGEETSPLRLQVVAQDPTLKKQIGDRVFFETRAEPEDPYVQAQVVFVRRLLYADGTQIYGEMPDTPEVKDAVVIPLGNATSSTVTRNDQRYGMIEQRYALFPESSGELEIPGATVSGSVRMNINGRLRRNGVRVIAEPIKLNVRPIPPEYPKDTPWLPATRVDLVEAWDQSPPPFTLGEPLEQTLIVRADAATGSIIPPLDYAVPESHFRSYPEQPDIVDNQRNGGLIGTRSQTWSLIPTELGSATLPMIELTWFDTVREEVRTSRLPSRTLTVAANATQRRTQTGGATDAEADSATSETVAQEEGSVMASDRAVFSGLGALILSIAVGLLLWFLWPFLRARLDIDTSLQRFIPAAVLNKQAKNALLEAAETGSVDDIRNQLRETLEGFKQRDKPVNAAAVAEINRLLSQASYARKKTELKRNAITAQVEALFASRQKSDSGPALPTLYPP